jgi:metal-responsive CopG/Arc/MetJ family transcriptional regulator
MKTAVSIPDDAYAEAEELVRRLRITRSQLDAAALREYLARHDPDAVTRELNRIYESEGTEPDPTISAAGVQTLQRVE